MQNIKQRYAWSCFAVFGGMALLIVFLITQLEMLSIIPHNAAEIISFAAVALIIISTIIIALKTGQSGSRIKREDGEQSDIINKKDDINWKLGMIYFNKKDSSLFVEKRCFILNFARPVSWLILAVIAIIIVGAIIINK